MSPAPGASRGQACIISSILGAGFWALVCPVQPASRCRPDGMISEAGVMALLWLRAFLLRRSRGTCAVWGGKEAWGRAVQVLEAGLGARGIVKVAQVLLF